MASRTNAKTDLISTQGLRRDGRRLNELRKFHIRTRVLQRADGSSYVSQGNTSVLCSVRGPLEPTAGSKGPGFHVEYLYQQRRLDDIGTALHDVFKPVLVERKTTLMHSSIHVVVMVLQDDGGHMACSINAVTLALVDAGVPLADLATACSIAYHEQKPILDLTRMEQVHADVFAQMVVAVAPHQEKITYMWMDGKCPVGLMGALLGRAMDACVATYEVLCDHVKKMAEELLARRSGTTDRFTTMTSKNEERDGKSEDEEMPAFKKPALAAASDKKTTVDVIRKSGTDSSDADDGDGDHESGEISMSDVNSASMEETKKDSGTKVTPMEQDPTDWPALLAPSSNKDSKSSKAPPRHPLPNRPRTPPKRRQIEPPALAPRNPYLPPKPAAQGGHKRESNNHRTPQATQSDDDIIIID